MINFMGNTESSSFIKIQPKENSRKMGSKGYFWIIQRSRSSVLFIRSVVFYFQGRVEFKSKILNLFFIWGKLLFRQKVLGGNILLLECSSNLEKKGLRTRVFNFITNMFSFFTGHINESYFRAWKSVN